MTGVRKRSRVARFGKSVKAISPTIAVLLMIAIAVVAALVVYMWMIGFLNFNTAKAAKAIQIQSAYYTGPDQGNYLGVYVQNVGQGKVTFIASQCLYVDGALRGTAHINPGPLEQATQDCQGGEVALVADEIPGLNVGQKIKIKVVTNEGTFMEQSFTINTFTGQAPYSLRVTVVGQGSVSRDNPGPYSSGDVVQLTATPITGWTFSAWSGDLSGSASPMTITINGLNTVTATFTQNNYSLTVYTVGQGTVAPGNGTGYHYGDAVQLTATPDIGWSFQAWGSPPGGSDSPALITISGDTAVTASFTQDTYVLTVTVSPTGAGTVGLDNAGPYHYGDVVQLTANAANGYTFSSWSGALGSANPVSVTITGDTAVTASFTQSTYVLTVTVSPTGAGTVSLDNAGPYHYGDVVTLTENPANGYAFSGWTGDGSGTGSTCAITFDGDKAVNATFTQSEYAINVTIDPSAGGTVTPDNSPPYHYGDVVTLTEAPNLGYTFSGWSGDGTGSDTTCVVTVTGNMTVTATFTQDQYTLTVNVVGTGCSVSEDPSQATYTYGTSVQLTPVAAVGWTFSGWSGDLTGNANPGTISMTGNETVTATFTQDQYTLTVNVVGTGCSVTEDPSQATYTYGTSVQLTPVAAVGWTFSGWSGDLTGNANPASISITGNTAITATFTLNTYQVTFAVEPTGLGTTNPSGTQNYTYGQVVPISASDANTGDDYQFGYWSATGSITFTNSSAASTTATINGAGTITAHFRILTAIYWYTTPTGLTIGSSETILGDLYTTHTVAGLNGKQVNMVYTAPDGTKTTQTFTTTWLIINGIFGGSFRPTTIGTWSVYGYFAGDSTYNASSIGPTSFVVDPVGKYTVSFAQTGAGVAPTVTYSVNSGSQVISTVPFGVLVNQGDTITYTYQAAVAGASGVQYVQTGVSPASPQTNINAAVIITGTYKTQYQISFAVTPTAGGSTNPSGTNVWEDTSLPISATPNTGYIFSSWSSGTGSITFGSSTSASTTATINGPGTITANFVVTATETLYPTSVTYYSGTQTSGTIANMQSDDNVYYVSTAGGSFLLRTLNYSGQFTASQSAGKTRVGLTVTLNSHYSATETQTLYLYNFATGTWVQQGNGVSIGTTDQTVTFSVNSGISNYVNAQNQIRVSIYSTALLSSAYTHSNDYFKVDVVYIP